MSLLELFCHVDDFMKIFLPEWRQHMLANGTRQRLRESALSVSEMVTILILFQHSQYRTFKAFYHQSVLRQLHGEFPRLLSYNRFVELIPRVMVPMCAYLRSLYSTSYGLAFIDSTPLAVCHKKRISRNKVFKDLAAVGKSTKGWFFGFKLHIICNHKGELIACVITPGNVDDRAPVSAMAKHLSGKLFGDKGYISQQLFDKLFAQGLKLVTGLRRNMKPKLVDMFDKLMLRKRALIESVNNQLKHVFQIEHTRHRSPINAFVNMISALVAYMHYPRKASLNLKQEEIRMLAQL